MSRFTPKNFTNHISQGQPKKLKVLIIVGNPYTGRQKT